MTTCDILLAHLCPLNNSFSPSLSRSSRSPPFPFLLLLYSSFSRSVFPSPFLPFPLFLLPSFSHSPPSLAALVLFLLTCLLSSRRSSFSLYLPLGLGLPPPRPTRKSRGEGTASEGSQRQLSKSCETGLDVYLLAQSAFISARVTRAVRYLLPWYVRKVSPVS